VFPAARVTRAPLAVLALGLSIVVSVLTSGCELIFPSASGDELKVLWAWPATSDECARNLEHVGRDDVAFFRFGVPPVEGTLAAVVLPEMPFTLNYCGQMVTVTVDTPAMGATYEVSLVEADGGRLLASAFLANPFPAPPEVTVSESRTSEDWDGHLVDNWTLTATKAVEDGDICYVGFGEVGINLSGPKEVPKEALVGALTAEPELAELHCGPVWNGHIQVTWPGVPMDVGMFGGRDRHDYLPDPAELLTSEEVPAGFASEMLLTIDTSGIPEWAGLAGEDGLFRIAVRRVRPPDLRIADWNRKPLVPYDGFRMLYSLMPGVYRFRVTFSQAMDRPSVERRLVNQALKTCPVKWRFEWQNNRILDLTIDSSGAPEGSLSQVYPEGALDRGGMPLWFTTPLDLRWTGAMTQLVRARVDRPDAPLDPPAFDLLPGLTPLSWSPDGRRLALLERASEPDASLTASYVWVYDQTTGEWHDLAASASPAATNVTWVSPETLYLEVGHGRQWGVAYLSKYGVAGSSMDLEAYSVGATVSSSGYRVLDFFRPDGHDRVDGLLHSGFNDADVTDGAKTRRVIENVSRMGGEDGFYSVIPAVWLPDCTGVVFVDRAENGQTRLAVLDVASGAVRPVAGTEGASRRHRGALVILGSGPVYCVYVTETPAEGGSVKTYLSVVELPAASSGGADPSAGRRVLHLELGQELGLEAIERCLPSPDGKLLAVAGGGGSVVIATPLGTAGPPGRTVAEFNGVIIGWSPDSVWVDLAIPGG